MTLDTVAHTFAVLELRCFRCGKSFRHYRPDEEMEHCDSTLCVCSGCGKLYCLSLWEDSPTHGVLVAIRRDCGGRVGEEAVMIAKLIPRCGCGAQIAVSDDLCPVCGSHNHVTMAVSTESRGVSPLSLGVAA